MKFQGFKRNDASGRFPEYGAIFISNCTTMEECFERKIFGLPFAHADFVREIKAGMILFLFEYGNRELYGVFEASSDGAMNIVPHAYNSSGMKFPAQVRFITIWNSNPLHESEFCDFIKDNYFTPKKFNFGLSREQVNGLLGLFSSRKVEVALVQNLTCNKKRHRFHGGDEEREKRSLKTRRRISSGVLDRICKQLRSTSSNDTECHEAHCISCSLISGTGCSSLGRDSGLSNFGQGSQLSMNSEESENLKGSSKDLNNDLENFIPLSPLDDTTDQNGAGMHTEEPQNLNQSSKDLRTDLGDFIPLSFPDDVLDCGGPIVFIEEPANMKHNPNDLKTLLEDSIPLPCPKNVGDCHRAMNGDCVVEKRISVFARLGKVSEPVRKDNATSTRLRWGNGKRNKKVRKANYTVQARYSCKVDMSVETSLDILQEDDQWKTSIREPVVSFQNDECEYNFMSGIQTDKLLKKRDPNEERVVVEGSNSNSTLNGNNQLETLAEEKSNSTFERRARRKLVRPSFYKSSEAES
ncbi:hypothetical protein FEM48_Zijuj05G0035300 [Ziziphus jujuba var. spinosa]|uniref:DCD domain-containing protein n=1 Tax=Ziziphus jujuba var. spinosa TaxID=714518 RepID=A0A978VCK4_ZIZJJ|nr:hypothetical protein FEM48_Zijuj05G0035300 [Ziziphus jujuba var. spinosa]